MRRYRLSLVLAVIAVALLLVVGAVRSSSGSDGLGAEASGAKLIATSDRVAAPEFAGIDGWINSPPLSLRALRGKVVLVDFWTFSCVNCVRTFPHLSALQARFKDRGLVIVGVHSPEFDFEKVRANVEAASRRDGVTWPVALDSEMATWNAYSNQYWPAEYLLDGSGRVAYVHYGEGAYQATETAVASLLGAKDARGARTVPADTPPTLDHQLTRELYAGSQQGVLAAGESYGNRDERVNYPDTGPPSGAGRIQVTGAWIDRGQYLEAASPGHVRLRYHARDLFIVAGSARGAALTATVLLDGAPVPQSEVGTGAPAGVVTVARNDLFQLVAAPATGDHLIDLSVPAGFQLFTFTFG